MNTIKLGADKIYAGEGALAALAELPARRRRAFIVMSGNIQIELDQYAQVEEILTQAGFTCSYTTEVEPEPTWPSIQAGVKLIQDFEPDWIIGFGGGSAMDAAKAMWVFYENPQYHSLEEVMPPAPLELRKKAHICCIATSAGTGSECTRAALIKDPIALKKYSIREYTGKLIPDVAILEPSFAKTCPKSVTVACGMDALTHAIESYVSKPANPFSDAQAIGGFITGFEALELCTKHPDDLGLWTKMLTSSCLGGIAFTNSALGICHGIAHSFGAAYNIPHGLANGVVLPYSIHHNAKLSSTARARYNRLARFIGVDDLENTILNLRERLGVPHTMREIIKDDARFGRDFESLKERVLTDVCTPANPVEITPTMAENLLRQVYYGSDE